MNSVGSGNQGAFASGSGNQNAFASGTNNAVASAVSGPGNLAHSGMFVALWDSEPPSFPETTSIEQCKSKRNDA